MSAKASKASGSKKRLRPLRSFGSAIVDRLGRAGNVLKLPGGEILLPDVFGFCRGVERALEMLDVAVHSHRSADSRLFLLGEIIHNPWVNEYFQRRGVRILSPAERDRPERFITAGDCAVIPAFGVPPEIQRRLEAIGCQIVDTSCGDVRRLWRWAEQAAGEGYGVLIFGRALHDETVVTKLRLAEAGGKYLVASSLEEVERFCDLITGAAEAERFREIFTAEATNAETLQPLQRLAQVSQTTMLYRETMKVRELLREAFERRFGPERVEERLRFEPTVCQATQARQSAAVELCRKGCDLTIVVGGFGSSNTRVLHELARSYAPAYLIESAAAIHSADELETYDFACDLPRTVRDWLPRRRPIRIAVLAGASSPEIVVGQVLEKLSGFLS